MTLRFCGIRHAFSRLPALNGVDLDIHEGEIVSLLGPSGSGKSTLLRLASGLERLQSGEIYFAERLIASSKIHTKPEDRDVGLVFQDHALFPHMTVGDNIAFGIRGQDKREVSSSVRSQLQAVGLGGFEDRFPHTLSGGQQQRVALARALASAPQILLLDEPFASIDISLRSRLRDETRQLLRKSGTTALMVTHDPEEAMEISDRVAILEEGYLVQVGTPEDLYRRPESAFVAEFFGGAQSISGTVESGSIVTPFGLIAASGVADLSHVLVAARPDAIGVRPVARTSSPACRILDMRFMGDHWLVFVEPAKPTHPAPPIQLKLQDVADLQLGAPVELEFDADQVFVFPA